MAEHKVPQDVEADDKLIGPFSFRQFVYLMITAGAGFVMFILGQIAIPLAFIPLPVAAFFLVLALPLRKDQPMEIYLSALVKYYFKPRIRIWQADGEQPFVEISNPTIDETPKTKDLAGDEVSRRLSFLANLSDTQGWSTRGLSAPVNNTNLNDEFASAAVNAEDIMESNALSDSIDNMLDRSERQVRQNAINAMNQAVQQQMVVPAKPIQPAQPVVLVQPVSVTPVTPAISPVAPVPAAAPSLTTPPVIPAAPIAPIIQSTGSPNLQAQAPQPRHNRLQVPTAQPQPQPSAPTPQLAPQPAAKPAIMDNKQTPPPAEQPRLVASDDSVIDIKLH